MIELQEQSDQQKNSTKTRHPRLRLILGLLGLVVVGIIVCQYVVLKAVSEWSTPETQRAVGNAMHRVVHFDNVWWSVSVYGVSLHSDKMTVTELDGQPFIDAGRTQISIALTPLLQKQIFLRHLDIDHLVVRVRKLSDDKWNYSDLPQMPPLRDLSHVRANDCEIDISDERDKSSKPVVLKSLNAKLDRTLLTRKWPFSLNADLVKTNGVSHLTASGVGSGNLDDWMKNEHSINVKAEALDLAPLAPYIGKVFSPGGPVSFAIDAKVLPEKSFAGKIDWQAPNVVLKGLQVNIKGPFPVALDSAGNAKLLPGAAISLSQGGLQLPGTKVDVKDLKGTIAVASAGLELHQLSGALGGMHFETDGEISQKQVANLDVHATNISLDDLKQLSASLKLPPAKTSPNNRCLAW